jgi:argininosuccinate synthase
MTRIVFAYPDTVWGQDAHRPAPDLLRLDDAIAWLSDHHGAEVVTLMLDFGQGRELEALRDRALAAGAVRAHVLDVVDQFTGQFLIPTLRAGALYLDGRSSTPVLARMAIAQKLVEIAAIEQTGAVAHGYSSEDRSLGTAVKALDASLSVIPIPASVTRSQAPPFADAVRNADRPAEPAFVDLTFARGVPTAINSVAMPTIDLINSLDMLSGAGRVSGPGTMAAMLLHDAHRALEAAVSRPSTLRQAQGRPEQSRGTTGSGRAGGTEIEQPALGRRYAELVGIGAWFSSERQALDTSVDRVQQTVNGTVRLQLVNNESRIVEVRPLEGKRMLNVTTPQ